LVSETFVFHANWLDVLNSYVYHNKGRELSNSKKLTRRIAFNLFKLCFKETPYLQWRSSA